MCNYRTQRTLPTPPRPRTTEEEGAFQVVVDHDEDIDLSTYFSDKDSEDEWEDKEDTKEHEKDIGYRSDDIYISDDESPMSHSDNFADISSEVSDASIREYTAGSSLQASARKIPFYTLLMSSSKPSNKNKSQQHLDAFVLCDTGARILLAPISIAQDLGMKIDRTELVSVRGFDWKKKKVVGTSYIYIRDKASPSWRWVKVEVIKSGNNFLLSCSDLKNLDLMSRNFPEYNGKKERGPRLSYFGRG